jgi:anti-sigma regulatory factor (Ser/Thr protein kinase)
MNFTIHFPANFENIPALRDMVAHCAALEGFTEKQSEHLRSVTDEICNNAIEHGSQPTSEVVLEVHTEPHSMKITCQDQGHGNTLKAADIQQRISGEVPVESGRGRGMKMIVTAFVDELKVEDRKDGGIAVTAIVRKNEQ